MKSFPLLILIFCIQFLSPISGQNSICSSLGIFGTDKPPGCLLCNKRLSFSNRNFSHDSVSGFDDFVIDNNLFISIPSDSEGKIHLNVTASLCEKENGLEAVFFDENLNTVGSILKFRIGNVPEIVELTGLTPNKRYSLMIDGIQADICNIDILLRSDSEATPIFSELAGAIISTEENLLQLCSGKPLKLSIPAVSGADFYKWKFPDFLHPKLTEGEKIELKVVEQAGNIGDISVIPYKKCAAGIESPVFQVGTTFPITKSVDFGVCHGKVPFEINGVTFSDSFTPQVVIFNASSGCDSIVTFKPIPSHSSARAFDTTFCRGSTFVYENFQTDEPGVYQFKASPSTQYLCDSFKIMTLNYADLSPPETTCVTNDFLNLVSVVWEPVPLAKSYQVFVNGELVSEQTNRSYFHKPDFSGEKIEFKIQPLSASTCDFEPSFSTCFAPDIAAQTEINIKESIQVSPNPSSGIFNISSLFKIEKIEVFDFSGKEILNQKGQEIDLSDKASGVYVLKIYTQKGVIAKRVFKI